MAVQYGGRKYRGCVRDFLVAMKRIIEAINAPSIWKYGGSAFKLRIYADSSFKTSDGQFILQGHRNGSVDCYLEIDCSVTADVPLIPSFEIDSTEDALINKNARYSAILVTQGGKKIPFLDNFAVPATDGPPAIAWPALELHNGAVQFQREASTTLTLGQIESLISIAVGLLNKASETNLGVVALSDDPSDPNFPIALSASSPRVAVDRGVETLVAGAATILSPLVLSTSIIICTGQDDNVSGAVRAPVSGRIDGVSFPVVSSNGLDNGVIGWVVYN